LIGIEEELIVAYAHGYANNETQFKRLDTHKDKEMPSVEDNVSPVRLKVPSTGKTPFRHKLIS
jgi:hypothetical protein